MWIYKSVKHGISGFQLFDILDKRKEKLEKIQERSKKFKEKATITIEE